MKNLLIDTNYMLKLFNRHYMLINTNYMLILIMYFVFEIYIT